MTAETPDGSADLLIDFDIRDDGWRLAVDDPEALGRRALAAAWLGLDLVGPGEVSVLLTDDATQQELNRTYRGKDAPTNVLSFPAMDDDDPLPPAGEPVPLGDIVLALETVRRESDEQGVPFADHLSHLLVHGMLHLAGYDHETADEAEEMEGMEIAILAGLGIADPYADTELAAHD